MRASTLVKLRSAQDQMVAKYPKVASETVWQNQIKSVKLKRKLENFQHGLHRQFVVFHIGETLALIESQIQSGHELSQQLSTSRNQYSDIYLKFAKELGEAASAGGDGHYLSMIGHSVQAAVNFFQDESALRSEVHAALIDRLNNSSVEMLHEFLAADHSVEAYLFTLREAHFYFQSEINQLYHAGQFSRADCQTALSISSAWQEEVIDAIFRIREYNFQQYINQSRLNESVQETAYRDLALRLVTEFLISPNESGKIGGVGELNKLGIKFLNARRDARIAEIINDDVSVRTESMIQERKLTIDKNSKVLKAFVATLKRHVLNDADTLLTANNEGLLSVLTDRLALMMKGELSLEEKLRLYGDYYFNKVERLAYNSAILEKKLLPPTRFFNSPVDKGAELSDSLRHLSRHLIAAQVAGGSKEVQKNECRLIKSKIEGVINFYYQQFKKVLFDSKKIGLCDPRRVDAFALEYILQALSQREVSKFHASYFHGLVKFKMALPKEVGINVVRSNQEVGKLCVVLSGGVFDQLKEEPRSALQQNTFFNQRAGSNKQEAMGASNFSLESWAG